METMHLNPVCQTMVIEEDDPHFILPQPALRPVRLLSAPTDVQRILYELSERLLEVKEESSKQEVFRQQSMKRLNLARGDLKNTLAACHKTMEVSAKCLSGHFRSIPSERLSQEIAERFTHFDKDHSGTLDKEEVLEGMAEMGQRPDAEELETFFAACDTDCNGSIDLAEFEAMVRVKLGLGDLKDIVSQASSLRNILRKKVSTFSMLGRRKSCPDELFRRKQLPPLKEHVTAQRPSVELSHPARARRGSLTALERSVALSRPSYGQIERPKTSMDLAILEPARPVRFGRRPTSSAEVHRPVASFTDDSRRRKSTEATRTGSGWLTDGLQGAKMVKIGSLARRGKDFSSPILDLSLSDSDGVDTQG